MKNWHSLSPDQLVRLLEQSGWTSGGVHPDGWSGNQRVNAALDGDMLVFTAEGSEVRLPVATVEIRVQNYIRGGEPYIVHVRTPRLVREQRKQIDGGGWHEVPRLRDAFIILNRSAGMRNDELYQAREEERQRESERRARAEAERAHASRQAMRDAFVHDSLAMVSDRTVTGLEYGDDNIVIVFGSGERLSFSATKMDPYNVREDPHLVAERSFHGAEPVACYPFEPEARVDDDSEDHNYDF